MQTVRNILQSLAFRRIVTVLIAMIIISSIGYGIYAFIQQKNNPIPAEVSNSLTFSPLILPTDVADYTTSDYKVATMNDGAQVFTYIVHTPDSNTVTVTEYRQPPEFSEVAEYKDRFLTNVVMQTSSLSTAGGTLYLGKQAKQADRQMGVMLERGLIVLFNPSKALDESTWRDIADQLDIQRLRKK